MSPWVRIAVGEPEIVRRWKDELLRLLFACCHPAARRGESAALALATVVGLSTTEIAVGLRGRSAQHGAASYEGAAATTRARRLRRRGT